jgi:hypothetical protein
LKKIVLKTENPDSWIEFVCIRGNEGYETHSDSHCLTGMLCNSICIFINFVSRIAIQKDKTLLSEFYVHYGIATGWPDVAYSNELALRKNSWK